MRAGGEKIYRASQAMHRLTTQCVGEHNSLCFDIDGVLVAQGEGSSEEAARRALAEDISEKCQSVSFAYRLTPAQVCRKIGEPIIQEVAKEKKSSSFFFVESFAGVAETLILLTIPSPNRYIPPHVENRNLCR